MGSESDRGASERLLAIVNAGTGLLLLIAAVVAASVGASRDRLLLPAEASFGAGEGAPVRVVLAQVDLVLAIVVMLAFVALLRFGSSRPAARGAWLDAVARDRHGLRWIELSQLSGITVFLVGQLNGIAEIPALVLLYAMGAAAPLMLVLHDRRAEPGRRGLLAYSFGTAIAIVPWGVIAFAQIGGGLAGVGPSVGVRVVTLVMLALVSLPWVLIWFAARPARAGGSMAPRVESIAVLLLALIPIVFVALTLLILAPG
ncbi:hypothetical protein OVN18_11150 [Microcella daejeonensis]|uniref:Uncharacterized protein n=1 Tax=Microcella daejeonensis TaxID=2994971 RepID=A0A9E8S8N4_9MICO|nr:hypothetical protein [Microcella daejeonensis]WAB81094.1 hypothetical protein OVN18_11150 [Microcella daejeonensis]